MVTESEARIQSIIKSAPSAVIEINEEGNVEIWNQKAEEMFGWKEAEMLGKPMHSIIMPERFRGQHLHGIKLFLATGDGPVLGKTVELAALRRDGSEFPIELSISSIIQNGKYLFIAFINDITERKKVREELIRQKSELEKSQQFLLYSQELGKVGSWERNLSDDKITGTKEFYRITDIKDAEKPNLTLAEYSKRVHPDDVQKLQGAISEALEKTGSYDIEYRIFHAGGREVYVWSKAKVVVDENNNPVRIYGTIMDITDRKATEEQINAANRFLTVVLENIPNMVFVKEAGELRFVRFNKAGENLLGYSREDLIGKNDYDFFPKEQADFFTAKDREVFVKGQIEDIPQEPIDTKNGKRFLHTWKVPINDDSGKPLYLLGISEDITDQIKASEELKRSHERFLSIVNLSPVAITISDINTGKMILANNACEKIFGYKTEQMIGKTASELKIIVDTGERNNTIEQLLGGKESAVIFEPKVKNIKGEIKDVLVSSSIIELDAKRCLISTITDISERKKLEKILMQRSEELSRVNEELESFSYSISHDLRAPLRAIAGYSNLLMEDHAANLDDNAKEFLHTIIHNTQRMGILIDDMLAFSRLSRKEVSKFSLDINSIFSDSFNELIKSQPPERKINFKLDALKTASGDKAMIVQVALNLLSNAIKFTGPRKVAQIHVGAKVINDEYIYFVEDNGVGFDSRYKEKLFGVFQRLHKDSEFEGTGVGLAIVQRIINKHGGKVWAESELNKGTTFYFTIPE